MTWKREMDQRDEVVRLDYIQRRKIEMELAREEAILAQEKKELENKENAMKIKKDLHEKMEERAKDAKEDFEKK